MRVFGDVRFELLVAAAELNILISQLGVLFLEPSDLCFKAINLLREVVDALLEMIRRGRPVESNGAEDTLEQADGGGRTLLPGLEDLVIRDGPLHTTRLSLTNALSEKSAAA